MLHDCWVVDLYLDWAEVFKVGGDTGGLKFVQTANVESDRYIV